MKVGPNEKFVLIGDSVTDVGRARPVAEGLSNPHGAGYVNVVQGLLTAIYPERMIRVVNMGNSGNTVCDLRDRWQTDVIDLQPDWVSVMIGVNDIWRQFDIPQIPERHVLPNVYEETLEALIVWTKPLVKGLVIMTPVYWESNKQDLMAAKVMEYGAICKRLSEKYGLVFVDAQAYADRLLRYCHSSYIAWDRVHPNVPGHHVLARALLDAIGFDFTHQS